MTQFQSAVKTQVALKSANFLLHISMPNDGTPLLLKEHALMLNFIQSRIIVDNYDHYDNLSSVNYSAISI